MVALVDRTNATTPDCCGTNSVHCVDRFVGLGSPRRLDTAFASNGARNVVEADNRDDALAKLASTDPMTCASLMEPPARANPADDR